MIKTLAFLLVLIVMLSPVLSSDVVDLNPTKFKQVVSSDVPYLVEFFAPWCGHCKQLAPTWEKVASGLKGVVSVGKVDCTVHQELCGKYGVQGYPTIKLFSKKGKVQDYQQARDARSIMNFATNALENNVFTVTASSEEKFWNKEPSVPHALLFSAKSEVTPLYKSLAIKYKSKIVFGQVKSTDKDLVARYGLESFPALIVLKSKDDTSPQKFEDSISAEALNNFFNSIAPLSESDDSQEKKAEETPAPPKVSRPPKKDLVLQETTEDQVDETCKNSYCLIGFIDKENGEITEAHKAILDTILTKFKKDDKLVFTYIDRSASPSLITKFSLSDAPSLVVYNSKRNRYLVSEKFEAPTIISTIERVLTGDAVYKNCA